MNTTTWIIWLIISSMGTVGLVLILIMFGKLLSLQVRIWFLARRGFHLVEHIGTNKIRTYFYLRPTDNKFEFRSGFYMHYPETTTKTEEILKPAPSGWKFRKLDDIDAKEGAELQERISKLVYDTNAVTLRWGIPVITYVGNSPYPVNFAEPQKEYGAQVIRDIYIRLLATEQFGFMKKIITIGVLILGVIALALLLLGWAYSSAATNTGACLSNLNATVTNLVTCTAQHAATGAGVTV